ncbi:MAG: hypothetical protein ACE5FT_02915 [Candidatus Nanoarchaeia archaeon]
MKELREAISEEKANMEELRNLQVDYLNQFKNNVDELKHLQDGAEKQLRQFTALSKEMSRLVLQKVEKELAQVTVHAKDLLSADIDEQKKLKEDIAITGRNLIGLNQKISDLADVARGIKKTDFQLSSYVQEIRKEDSKKLQLMQEVDRLKSMMAKMKRRQ